MPIVDHLADINKNRDNGNETSKFDNNGQLNVVYSTEIFGTGTIDK